MYSPEGAFCSPCGTPLSSHSQNFLGDGLTPVVSPVPRARRPRTGQSIKCVKVPPLELGPNLTLTPPVILAPMAGVTNYPFRKLCREYGAALYVSEMVHAAAILEGNADRRCRFGPDEKIRSAQLYGTDPGAMSAAAAQLIEQDGVAHIDLNFGCPARKVLRKGGGAALTRDPKALGAIVRAVVEAARPHSVPVTAKIRLGLSWMELTYLDAGRAIQENGGAAVTLHSRTAMDMYAEGVARRSWVHIKGLARALDIPVLGNGDVFTAIDAMKMLSATNSAGVVIGRGCLGRPWLFRDLRDALTSGWAGETTVPGFGYVARTVLRHVKHSVDWEVTGGGTELDSVRAMRKWYQWYFRGYNKLPHNFVVRLCKAESVAEIEEIVLEADQEAVGYKYEKGIGDRGKMGYMELPKKTVVAAPKKRKSASQRLPTTMKGQIQMALRERLKAEEDEKKEKERKAAARKWARERRIMEI